MSEIEGNVKDEILLEARQNILSLYPVRKKVTEITQ